MNNSIHAPEMTVLLAALFTGCWFSSTANGFLDACGNAVFLPMLACGLILTALTCALYRLAPRCGLYGVCTQHRIFSFFPLIGAVLFTLLAATALRDTLDLFHLFLLPETPRWFMLLMLLPLLLLISLLGLSSVSRAIKLVAPMLVVLYLAVLVLSVWNQADVYNFFPILGGGVPALTRTALSGLSVAAWIPMLWIDRPQLGKGNGMNLKAGLLATALCVTGYVFYALFFPNGTLPDSAFPLHRLCASGGFSSSFQRTHALFVFVWLPVQLAAIGAGLCYAVRSLHCVVHVRNPRILAALPLAAAAILAWPTAERSPQWLTYLLQTNMQALLALPLLLPLIAGKVQELRRRPEQEESHA